mgnify:CR=1 FL=1
MEISVNSPFFVLIFFVSRPGAEGGSYCTGAKKIWIWSKRACGASICGMCFVFGRIWVSMEVLSAVYSAKVSAMPGSSSPPMRKMLLSMCFKAWPMLRFT